MDNSLLGQDRDITDVIVPPHLFAASKEMEELVFQNFLVIKDFREHLLPLHKQDGDKSSVKDALFSHYKDIFEKVFRVFLELSFEICQWFDLELY